MIGQVYKALVGLAVPELCPRCRGPTEAGFCAGCRGDFVRNEHCCPVCGLGAAPGFAAACKRHAFAWRTAAVRAPYVYCDPIGHYLHALKFHRERRLGRAFGLLLAAALDAEASTVDALVAVPLHGSRLRERGFNQAQEIARCASRALGLPALRAGIVRRRPTPPQTGLGRRQRQRNLRRAFAVRRKLDDRRIAIVDDVITTGATVNALAEALLDAGASRVEAWAVARTPPPSQHAIIDGRESSDD